MIREIYQSIYRLILEYNKIEHLVFPGQSNAIMKKVRLGLLIVKKNQLDSF